MTEPLLVVDSLDVRYGTSQALFDVSLSVAPGSVTAVLGANGAGKSTLARTVSGLVPTAAGRVSFDGITITGQSTHHIRKLGLTYIPEGRGIFPGLSVLDNLRMAVAQEKRGDRADAIDRAIGLFPVLGQRRTQRAGSLSGGEQQMLALARALTVPPAPHHCRRDVVGPGTDRGRVGVPKSRRSGTKRHHHCAHRAVRPPCARTRRQLCHSDARSGRVVGPGVRGRSGSPGSLPR